MATRLQNGLALSETAGWQCREEKQSSNLGDKHDERNGLQQNETIGLFELLAFLVFMRAWKWYLIWWLDTRLKGTNDITIRKHQWYVVSLLVRGCGVESRKVIDVVCGRKRRMGIVRTVSFDSTFRFPM